ncbi:hypothetical protein N7457_001578 [Penicillium paradoxum]|uniref:uncharacterized protein n=1 Tax=Penicillium paradoxum TaxID=176176 RepID=UPI0025466538|nr:uncharacterized protein N7457_001578 [Penicillium paradoxum]KAJ5794979.1 hypothetical protein N7457_001578 [Penicillium paradoxum]
MAPNIRNIQGDIWPRLPKKYETFLFFEIGDEKLFKEKLAAFLQFITTAESAHKVRGDLYNRKKNALMKTMCTNISFSASGLKKLGNNELDQDDLFQGGMYADMVTAGLDRDDEWLGEFKGSRGQIDGVFTLAASSEDTVTRHLASVLNPMFQPPGKTPAAKWLFTQSGAVLNEYDIEHFGWKDGVSQPQILGLDADPNGDLCPRNIKPGYIIVGEDGDTQNPPAWAHDGSFMVFRRLRQLVPEFTQWVVGQIGDQARDEHKNMKLGVISNMSSRIMGRWPNGISLEEKPAPSDVYEDKALPEDNHNLSPEDKALLDSNNFDFTDIKWQDKCPFASHIRKVRPRAERLGPDGSADDTHAMIRRGISFGPLTESSEKAGGVTLHDRGLLFVSYQSNLQNGFRHVQNEWANKVGFPPGKSRNYDGQQPGLDPIIGQWPKGETESNFISMPRFDDPRKVERWTLDRTVIAEGGEYFFTPSMSALKELCGK